MAGELTDGLFTTAAMRAAMSDRARVQAMLDFEAALTRGLACEDVIPASAVASVLASWVVAPVNDAWPLAGRATAAGRTVTCNC